VTDDIRAKARELDDANRRLAEYDDRMSKMLIEI
jgi:hypothetical protein